MITIKIHHHGRWSLQTKAEDLTQALFMKGFKIPKERQNLLFFESIKAGVYAEIDLYNIAETKNYEWVDLLKSELFIDKVTVTYSNGKSFGEL